MPTHRARQWYFRVLHNENHDSGLEVEGQNFQVHPLSAGEECHSGNSLKKKCVMRWRLLQINSVLSAWVLMGFIVAILWRILKIKFLLASLKTVKTHATSENLFCCPLKEACFGFHITFYELKIVLELPVGCEWSESQLWHVRQGTTNLFLFLI
jgi:hypothetical protein